MNTDDISIDCETLSTRWDAPIISIGAVHFNRTTGKLAQTFYEEIDIESALKHGRPSGSTISWWINQSKTAKLMFGTPDTQKLSLATVLQNFSIWCRSVCVGVPRPWFNGPAEDAAWLLHASDVGGHGLAVPWHHTNVRDLRTVVELATEIADFDRSTVKPVGTEHNALDDAVYQANLISAAYAALEGAKIGKALKAAVKAGNPRIGKALEEDDDEL